MVKPLLILCLIATAGFGADKMDYISAHPFFNQLLTIFGVIFKDIRADFFKKASSVYVSGTLSAMLTIVILIYATRKVKEGTFEFPKDIVEIIIFLLMITFVNYCLHNYNQLAKILDYLDIPADEIARIVQDTTNKSLSITQNTQRSIGGKLGQLLAQIYEMQNMMVGTQSANPFKAIFDVLLKFILWLAYAWFAFILVASIGMTYILTFLQAEFWKMFGVIMIPLIYFKATRGMVIFWVKTIIALSLISAFVTIIAHLSLQSEVSIISTIGKVETWEIDKGMGMSYVLIGTIIISKIILITFLKEIPAMINGMLGTSAGGSTGAFANSVAMGSIGAAAAGAGFAAFKGAMKAGAGAKATGKALGNATADATKGIGNTIAESNMAKKAGSAAMSKLSGSNVGRQIASVGAGLNSMRKGESFQSGHKSAMKNFRANNINNIRNSKNKE